MKNIFNLVLSIFILFATSMAVADEVRVKDADAVLLYRYAEGAGVQVVEDTHYKILHSDILLCSIYLNVPQAPKKARCLLPSEQVRIENDNAVEVTDILKKYEMPTDNQFGYETVRAGLDCLLSLTGDQYPVCYLSAK